MRRAKRLGGGYQPIQEENKENPKEGEIDKGPEETEEDSIILRRDNLPIVDLIKCNTEGKEAKYVQIRPHRGSFDNKQESHRRKHKEGRV